MEPNPWESWTWRGILEQSFWRLTLLDAYLAGGYLCPKLLTFEQGGQKGSSWSWKINPKKRSVNPAKLSLEKWNLSLDKSGSPWEEASRAHCTSFCLPLTSLNEGERFDIVYELVKWLSLLYSIVMCPLWLGQNIIMQKLNKHFK